MGELFSTFGINGKLLLMQSVNFGLLLLVLWKFVYRPVLTMIDERREKIAEGVRIAEAADQRLAAQGQDGRQGLVAADPAAVDLAIGFSFHFFGRRGWRG